DPGIAVIPVAYPANRSRQGRRRGRDKRAVNPVIAKLQGDRGPPHHRLLRPMIAEVCHPPPPRVGRVAQHDVGVKPVMAVKPSSRPHRTQPDSLCELMDALETGQRTVGTKVQTNVRSREGLYL